MSAAKAKKPSKAEQAKEPEVIPTPRLQEKYAKEILPGLAEKFGRTNPFSLPRLKKIVVNMGVGKAIAEKKYMEDAVEALRQITGQKPLITLSRKAIANFKLRENLPIGCKVTLRGKRMWEFLDRLVSIALPRVRDFRGINRTAIDSHGVLTVGLRDQFVFPEIEPERSLIGFYYGVSIVPKIKNAKRSWEEFTKLGVPMKKEEQQGKKKTRK